MTISFLSDLFFLECCFWSFFFKLNLAFTYLFCEYVYVGDVTCIYARLHACVCVCVQAWVCVEN